MEKSLDDLLNKIKVGDKHAFQEFYKMYYKRVYYFALQICKNSQDAQDIAQETFIQLQKSLPSLKENRAFQVWLHRVIISKAGMLFRKNKEIVLSDDHVVFNKNREQRSYMLPNESMHFESDKEMMSYLLNQLDEKYRVVLTLVYFSNLKIKEVSEILDVPEGTVKSRMSTAKELLKQKIESYQKREGVRLDFKAINMAGALTAFFVAEATSIAIPKFLVFPYMNLIQTLVKNIGTHAVSTSVLLVTGTIIAYSGYQSYQSIQEQGERQNNVSNQAAVSIFSAVKYQNHLYDNAEDAYHQLLKWAHCEVEMKQYTISQGKEIQPLYNAIKAEKSVYWLALERKEWSKNFENIFQ